MNKPEPRYPLASSGWDADELGAVQRVLDSGMYTMGEEVRRFEVEFARYMGSRFAVMVNSGSSANLLAVAALFYRRSHPLQPGDEIIVPAVSWPTTYYPLAQYGLRLKFVDIDRHTLNLDLNQLEAAVGPKTRGVFLVNLLGNPNDFSRVQAIADERNLLILEDNCESLGATFEGRRAGTFGLMGTHSTFFSHHMATMEGGLMVTDDEELYHILLCLRAHGWTRDLPPENLVTGTKGLDSFDESFRFVLPGYNVRPLEMSGAIGLEQLRKLPEFVRIRRSNADLFRAAIHDLPGVGVQEEVGQSSWFGFSMVFSPYVFRSRREVVDEFARRGIECRPIVAGNFYRNPVVRFLDHEVAGDLKVADEISEWGLFVGNHHYEIPEEIALLRSALEQLIS
ncbi:MAG: DegT/DnrJ/EryC1/StrS family aminotransferase [Dehalococcoidia bacterium]